jgi:hypothetical protein
MRQNICSNLLTDITRTELYALLKRGSSGLQEAQMHCAAHLVASQVELIHEEGQVIQAEQRVVAHKQACAV